MLSLKLLKDCLVDSYHRNPERCHITREEDGRLVLNTQWGRLTHDATGEQAFVFHPKDRETADLARFAVWFSELGRVGEEMAGKDKRPGKSKKSKAELPLGKPFWVDPPAGRP